MPHDWVQSYVMWRTKSILTGFNGSWYHCCIEFWKGTFYFIFRNRTQAVPDSVLRKSLQAGLGVENEPGLSMSKVSALNPVLSLSPSKWAFHLWDSSWTVWGVCGVYGSVSIRVWDGDQVGVSHDHGFPAFILLLTDPRTSKGTKWTLGFPWVPSPRWRHWNYILTTFPRLLPVLGITKVK